MPRVSRLPPTIQMFDGCPVQESPGPSSLQKDLGVARDPQLEPAVQDWADAESDEVDTKTEASWT